MRFIAVILVAYMSLLTVTPVICGTYIVLEQAEICCNSTADNQCSTTDNQCSEEQTCNKQTDETDSNSSCMTCCTVQNCHCNFVNAPQFNFLIQTTLSSKRAHIKNDKVLNNYLSDCWQPPELI